MKKIEKLIIATFCLGLFSGCASVNYTTPTGEKMNYLAIGKRKLTGLNIEKDKATGLVKLSLSSAEGDSGNLLEVMKNISTVMLKTVTPVP